MRAAHAEDFRALSFQHRLNQDARVLLIINHQDTQPLQRC
jgi:hypothetical protein